ncbi:hypothetical protein OBBRIDRAFT_45874 [Obba rivulosa]|uniref:Uncharacterized protein n=1 Tax=Obba rivulosa TaxID=1052685 RepID=A0A8E2DJ53_9APHY|nr:hypothetical protein OBBRIDRAFT_45874 [Obba rivulosa]
MSALDACIALLECCSLTYCVGCADCNSACSFCPASCWKNRSLRVDEREALEMGEPRASQKHQDAPGRPPIVVSQAEERPERPRTSQPPPQPRMSSARMTSEPEREDAAHSPQKDIEESKEVAKLTNEPTA